MKGACSRVCDAKGIDVEDLVSLVCECVLASNLRDSAYDPGRSSVTRYIRTVAVSRLAHLIDKQRRRARSEQVGMLLPSGAGGRLVEGDAAKADVETSLCPDVMVTVSRLLPHVLELARAADDQAAAAAPARAVADTTGDEQGWREQAVQWVVLDSPSSAAAAGWWRCTVKEANARLLWARDLWTDAVHELLDGHPVDDEPALERRPLPRFV